jgi:hypothetical protein
MTLTRPEAATLALYLSGGAHQSAHTEDVAIRAVEVAPGMFAWEKHPDRIDKELVRVALSDARLKKGYVLGSHDKGWMLTPTGMEYARRNAPSRDGQTGDARRGKAQQAFGRERARLMSTDAFEKFHAGRLDEVSDDEADAFFRLNIYVRGQARQRKIARIANEFTNDDELGDLVTTLAKRARNRE